VLSEELTRGLKELSRSEGVTLFMTLLAAFQTLLYRYSGQDDIVVGTPIAGRSRIETEPLIGFFVNTLVLRTKMSGEPSFRELLGRVREATLGAYAHQELPFEKLVEELQPERSLSHTPLFQVMFLMQNAGREVLRLEGLELSAVGVERETAKFDLLLAMSETERSLDVTVEYNVELFEGSTISRMMESFQKLLEAVTQDAEQPVTNLRLLLDKESGGYTAADFPDAELSQNEFEQLVMEINRATAEL
jgi:non-ribosomal peptide synthetase component F